MYIAVSEYKHDYIMVVMRMYHLYIQDESKLHPLSPEVISRQATINIGKYSIAYDDGVTYIM